MTKRKKLNEDVEYRRQINITRLLGAVMTIISCGLAAPVVTGFLVFSSEKWVWITCIGLVAGILAWRHG